MVKFKSILQSCALITATSVMFSVTLAFQIFNLVAVGICGVDCPAKMLGRVQEISGRPLGDNIDVWTPLLVYSIIGVVMSIMNILSNTKGLRSLKFIKIITMILGLGFFATLIWFLVEHYMLWDGMENDALSEINKHLYICGSNQNMSISECKSLPGNDEIYLMYYADVITECIFYIACGLVVVGIIVAIIICCLTKKAAQKPS